MPTDPHLLAIAKAAQALVDYEVTGLEDNPPHLYWEEHFMELQQAVDAWNRRATERKGQ